MYKFMKSHQLLVADDTSIVSKIEMMLYIAGYKLSCGLLYVECRVVSGLSSTKAYLIFQRSGVKHHNHNPLICTMLNHHFTMKLVVLHVSNTMIFPFMVLEND
jgi:hypothetical protein